MAPPVKKQKTEEHIAVTRFREYLRINTMQPSPDYQSCLKFLQKYAQELGLAYAEHSLVKGKPIVVLKLEGTDPNIKSIILNSHTDVVPVDPERWEHPPFDAFKKSNGDIVARGAQDMKCVGIWYMEAIRKIIASKTKLKKTLHLTFVPDEEIGGKDGMQLFVKSPQFKSLNAGFALDEGLANENDAFKIYYGERSPWWVWLTSRGEAGHGSKFLEPSAVEKLLKVLKKFSEFRESEKLRLEYDTINGQRLKLGDVTSTNINMINVGVQMNCVPATATAGIDMRLSPTLDFKKFESRITEWAVSEDVEIEFKQKTPKIPSSILDDANKEWQILKSVADKRGILLEQEIFPAATDSRFLRQVGIPAFGISAIKNTPVLLHDHNEYLNEKSLIDGIDFYVDLITGLAQ